MQTYEQVMWRTKCADLARRTKGRDEGLVNVADKYWNFVLTGDPNQMGNRMECLEISGRCEAISDLGLSITLSTDQIIAGAAQIFEFVMTGNVPTARAEHPDDRAVQNFYARQR